MRTENRYHRALIYSLVAFLLVTFAVCSSPTLYARGSSDRGDSQSRSDSSESKRSQDNSRSYDNGSSSRSDSGYSKSESNYEQKHEQRSEERHYTPPSQPSVPPPPPPAPRNEDQGSYYGSKHGNNSQTYRNDYSQEQSRSSKRDEPKQEEPKHEQPRYEPQNPTYNTGNTGSPKNEDNQSKHSQTQYGNQNQHGYPPTGGTIYTGPNGNGSSPKSQDNNSKHDRIVTPNNGHSSSQSQGGFQTLRDSNLQSKHQQDVVKRSVVTNSGTYRKDFADFSKFWKERREQRTVYDNTSHYDDHYYGGSHSGVHVNFNFFPGACYSYYAYDYDPWSCYPSVYSYYYGLFPPYIHSRRVVVYHYPVVHYTYIEIPIAIIYRDDSYYYDRDDYYLSSYRYSNVGSALRDIERAWLREDPNLLFDHIDRGSKIDVFLNEDYAYTLDSQDYHDMTVDAMSHIKTTRFEFYRVRQRGNGEVIAYGKHTYYDYDAYGKDDQFFGRSHYSTTTTYVSYTLERYNGEWYITEVGSSPDKL